MDGSRHIQQSNTVCDQRIHNSPNSLILMGRGNIYNINTVQDTTAHQQSQHQSQPQPQAQPESVPQPQQEPPRPQQPPQPRPQTQTQSPSAIKGRKYPNSPDGKVNVSKKIVKRKRLLDHGDKGLIIKIYRENKEKDPRHCMIKTIKQVLGVKNVNSKDYNNYRNQIYHWIKKL